MGLAALAALVAVGVYLKPSIPKRQPATAAATPASGWLLIGASFADSTHGTAQLRRYPTAGMQSTVSLLTSDGGKTWQEVASSHGDSFAAVSFVGSGPALLRVQDSAEETAMQLSGDGGRTWGNLTSPQRTGHAGLPVFLDAMHAWWVDQSVSPGSPVGIWRTADGGRSWQRLASSGLQVDGVAGQVVFTDLLHGVLVSWSSGGRVSSGLFATVDGGETWHAVEAPAVPLQDVGLSAITLIKHDRRLLACLVAVPASVRSGSVDISRRTPVRQSVFVSLSDDGGQTWSSPRAGPVVLQPVSYSAVPRQDSGGRLLLLDDRSLWISSDDGATWIPNPVKVPPHLRSGLLAGAGPGTLFSLAEDTSALGGPRQTPRLVLLQSTDGGAHWSQVALPRPAAVRRENSVNRIRSP